MTSRLDTVSFVDHPDTIYYGFIFNRTIIHPTLHSFETKFFPNFEVVKILNMGVGVEEKADEKYNKIL